MQAVEFPPINPHLSEPMTRLIEAKHEATTSWDIPGEAFVGLRFYSQLCRELRRVAARDDTECFDPGDDLRAFGMRIHLVPTLERDAIYCA